MKNSKNFFRRYLVYFSAQVLNVCIFFFLFYFSEELGITKFLGYILIGALLIMFIIFVLYRRFINTEKMKGKSSLITKQPWN